jgi:Spy/CpxP family protein refolding chaperone
MEAHKMKPFLVALTTTLLLVAVLTGVNAQETDTAPKGQMPMMEGGMKCPMCGQMMSEGMMGKKGGMMGQMPMKGGMMGEGGGMMGQMPMKGGMMNGSSPTTGQASSNLPSPTKYLATAEALKLTNEQVKSLKALARNVEKETIRKLSDAAIARVELNALLDEEDINTEKVQKTVRRIHELEAERNIAEIQASVEAAKILNAAQRAHFKELTAGKAPAAHKAKTPDAESAEHEKHH